MVLIEVLYFESCPGWRSATARVCSVLRDCGLERAATIRMVPIETADEACKHRFVGSPTIRVDGRDVERAAETVTSFGLQCRVYMDQGLPRGIPPTRLIRAALVDVTEARG